MTTNTIMKIKSRRMKWPENIAHMKDEECIQNFSWRKWREETTWKT